LAPNTVLWWNGENPSEIESIIFTTNNTRLRITEKGCLGSGPADAKVDDKIRSVWGECSVRFES